MAGPVPILSLLALLAAGVQQDSSPSTDGRRHAVVIGVGSSCATDAQRIGAALEQGHGYAKDRIEVLAGDVGSRTIAVESIRLALERLRERANRDDGALVVLVGAVEVSQDELLLRVSQRDAFALSWLAATLDALEAREVGLILDVTPPGSAPSASARVERLAPTLRAPVLLSCSADEVSHRTDAGTESLFCASLVAGLAGAADTDRDGSVDLGELFEHVGWDLTVWSLEQDAIQTPRLLPEGAASVAVTGPVRLAEPLPTPARVEAIDQPDEPVPFEPAPEPPIQVDEPEVPHDEQRAPTEPETTTEPSPLVTNRSDVAPTSDGAERDLGQALGLKLGRVTSELANFYEIARGRGAIILDVVRGSPAERAGVEPFDLLLAVDGTPFEATDPPIGVGPAGSVTLALQRGWDRLDLEVRLAAPSARPILGFLVRSTEPARGEPALGVRILAVQPGGAADRAGLAVGDYLVSFDETLLRSSAHLVELTARVHSGDRVPFEAMCVERGGRTQRARGVIEPDARSEVAHLWDWTSGVELTWGVRLQPLEPERAAALGLSEGAGLRVSYVHRPSPADDAWLEVGDVLLEIDGHEARVLRSLSAQPQPDVVLLRVFRDGRTRTVDMRKSAWDG